MKELFENLSHSNWITVHQHREEGFFDDNEFLKKFYSNFTQKIKPNHISSIDENSWDETKQGVKSRFNMNIKECDQPDAKVEKHKCIKSRFESEKRLLGPSSLKFEAGFVGEEELYHEQNSKAIDLSWTQPIQGCLSLENYRQQSIQNGNKLSLACTC